MELSITLFAAGNLPSGQIEPVELEQALERATYGLKRVEAQHHCFAR